MTTRMDPFTETMTGAGSTLPVSEQFGPTIQGEGRHAGRAVQFLRLGGCNLSCSWCDTAYTWDSTRYDLREELTPTAARDIVHAATPELTVVLSGGEPLMHQHTDAFAYVLAGLGHKGCPVHVETNGTLAPNETSRYGVEHFTVSPKLSHAGTHKRSQSAALHPGWLKPRADRNADMKFVVRDASDVKYVAALVDEWGWPRASTYVMPLGTTAEELQDRWGGVARAAATLHLNACHRTHVLAWGDIKGT